MISVGQSVQAQQMGKLDQSSRGKDLDETKKLDHSKELEGIKKAHEESKAAQIAQIMSEVQSIVKGKAGGDSFEVQYQDFQDFLGEIGYEGKPIASLSQDEAAELVSEDGFFGVAQTSERLAQFVISGSGGDEELLRAGRKGILQGLKDAEDMWGGKLPDIAYETMDKAVAMVDQALADGGFSVLDATA